MRRYQLSTRREAVNFALRTVAAEPLGLDEARALRGSGWDGDQRHLRDLDWRLGEKCGFVLDIAVRHQLRVGPVVRNRLNWST